MDCGVSRTRHWYYYKMVRTDVVDHVVRRMLMDSTRRLFILGPDNNNNMIVDTPLYHNMASKVVKPATTHAIHHLAEKVAPVYLNIMTLVKNI